jgi:hypothetical protein
MSTGRCPYCKSQNYIPDRSPGGTGRNVCMTCGRRAVVAAFHEPDIAATVAPRITLAPVEFTIPTNEELVAVGMDDFHDEMKLRRAIIGLKTSTPPAPIRQYKDDD